MHSKDKEFYTRLKGGSFEQDVRKVYELMCFFKIKIISGIFLYVLFMITNINFMNEINVCLTLIILNINGINSLYKHIVVVVMPCHRDIEIPFFISRFIRSIDFAKANGNIVLVPRLETVCIPEALAVAVAVIRFVVTI